MNVELREGHYLPLKEFDIEVLNHSPSLSHNGIDRCFKFRQIRKLGLRHFQGFLLRHNGLTIAFYIGDICLELLHIRYPVLNFTFVPD
jgi:hypothetical protein